MALAGRLAGDPNVALLFYSGHGVEVAASPAILASDVLTQRAADGGASRAIAVEPTTAAVKTYNISRGLFFIDACRDAPQAARLLNLVGDDALKPNRNAVRRPDGLIRLHSTASGLKSYQVKDETGTLFTQAVLSGLQGEPPAYVPYDTTNLPWALKFAALEGHVKRAVNRLLAEHSPLAIQLVEPYGNPYNAEMLVALKAGPPLDAGDVPAVSEPTPANVEEVVERSAADVLKNIRSLNTAAISDLRGPAPGGVKGDLFNFNVMHEVLGHESVTDPWIRSLRFLDAWTGESVDPTVAEIFAAHRQEIDGRIAAWVDMTVQPGQGEALWIAAGAGGDEDTTGAAIAIPRDAWQPIPVRLDIQFDASEGPWKLRQMSARLADPAGAEVYLPSSWQTLFEAQRIEAFADLASAARPIEQLADLQDVVSGKRESPVAAAFATNLLLRAGAIDYLHDWPRNLAEWFPWLADGPVLWAETLLRRREGDELDLGQPVIEEALRYFTMLSDRGAPLVAHSLGLALRQADLWRPFVENDALDGGKQSNLRAALEYVDRAGRFAQSSVGFSRFVGAGVETHPDHVLGRGRYRPQQMLAVA
ncbi:caspase family protein [Sphingomonas sp. Root710]|uniref:caspase family protein n=1 Tax=Sphingomonas sp. Root710 TaxID=1736594 RepID=UPI00138F8E69